MIFIVRHQSGTRASNCLNKEGLYNVRQMAKHFYRNPLILSSIYTVKPRNYKHVRPLQTASNLCTLMDDGKSVLVCDTHEDVVRDLMNFSSTCMASRRDSGNAPLHRDHVRIFGRTHRLL